MRTDLSVRAVHLGDMRCDVYVRGNVLSMDYPAADDRNPTPLEVLLSSLAACAGNTLNLVLGKMGSRLASIEVEAKAERRAEHPTVLTAIELVYHLRGDDLAAETVEQAIRKAEDQLCPVYAMLKPGTQISTSWQRN